MTMAVPYKICHSLAFKKVRKIFHHIDEERLSTQVPIGTNVVENAVSIISKL